MTTTGTQPQVTRKQIKVKEVKPPREYQISKGPRAGQTGKAYSFIGEDNINYQTFSDTVAVYFAQGKTLEIDVETRQREYNGQTYTDYVIKQVYHDGQPMSGQGKYGGKPFGKSPEERLSIEEQTAAKIAGELMAAKVIPMTDPLAKATVNWCLAKLGCKGLTAPAKPAQQAAGPDDIPF